MRLYVANVTHQRQIVYYRLDFHQDSNASQRVNSLKHIAIEGGRQVTIGGDLMPTQAQMIMDQLAPYGGVGVEEISRLPLHKVHYVMSFGKEVPAKVIKIIDEHNLMLMTKEGDERRRRAAIAMHPVVSDQIDNLRKLDVEMLEVPPEPGDPEPVGKPLDFGVHLDPKARDSSGQQSMPPRGKRGRR